jgi:hypothetical protein
LGCFRAAAGIDKLAALRVLLSRQLIDHFSSMHGKAATLGSTGSGAST